MAVSTPVNMAARMQTNCDLTLYKKSVVSGAESWTRSVIERVFWEEGKGVHIGKGGTLEADRVSVYIPMARGDSGIKAGDVIVKGQVTDVITGSFTISSLKAKYPHSAIVRAVETHDYGSSHMQHWRLGAT